MLSLIQSTLTALLVAAGQLFTWLNRRDERKERDANDERITDLQQAAAKPSQENADLLNRWLARGRAGRLRRPPRSS